jgi:hypothetical protein
VLKSFMPTTVCMNDLRASLHLYHSYVHNMGMTGTYIPILNH